MNMRWLTLVCWTCLQFTLAAGTIRIAADGKASSRIVIDRDAPVPVQFAARELQNYFRLISGARISIMNGLPADKETAAAVLAEVNSPLVEAKCWNPPAKPSVRPKQLVFNCRGTAPGTRGKCTASIRSAN